MSRSSAEARNAHRAALDLIPIVFAVLLAWLSTGIGAVEPRQHAPHSADARAAIQQSPNVVVNQIPHGPRGVFAAEIRDQQARSYHPTFQTSDSAGTLGFWILASLCGLLLGAALAPFGIHRLRQHFRADDPRS